MALTQFPLKVEFLVEYIYQLGIQNLVKQWKYLFYKMVKKTINSLFS